MADMRGMIEISVTLSIDDMKSLEKSAESSDESGIIEHILTLAKDNINRPGG